MTTNKKLTPSTALHPIVTPILNVKTETPRNKRFTLSAAPIARIATPGQFMMVWIPGTDEIPMSISNASGDQVEFTVARVGDATTALHKLKPGDLLGVRGPLGEGFVFPKKPKGKALLLVAGGCGTPPILFAATTALETGFAVDVALGATTSEELLFQQPFKELKLRNLVVATDDGSEGIQGTSVDAAAFLLEANSEYAASLACGPEGMLVNLNLLLQKFPIPLQVSLERYMKCGVGLCGHCIIDSKGRRVCHEGPVFDVKTLKNSDFGRWTRDSTGKRHPVNPTDTTCPS
ncbi:MAG: dihydroorotate dehydrogenase electron transfer subunit [Candidatus Hermodarchaeota archaeon]|nr:dihydroorotate dehydrogenase electron transfer subunit [Candidatus Hermodarchaeota archaeon]